MSYQAALAYLLYLLGPAIMMGCAAGPGTHKEGYYIVMNGNTNNRMCCTLEGFAAARRAIDQHDESAARAILFHTNPEWRNIGSSQRNRGIKYYAYSSHLYQGDTDWQMAKLWQEFNRAFGYGSIPWLDGMIEEQNATAARYWKDSQAELNSSTNSSPGSQSIGNGSISSRKTSDKCNGPSRPAGGALTGECN